MADTANPTTPGAHNHLGHAPASPQMIEGLRIEDGHGCKPIEWQIAEHVLRIFVANGRDESKALLLKLLSNNGINQEIFAAELVARGLMSAKTVASERALDEFTPSGSPN
jgi:hypothetical protein